MKVDVAIATAGRVPIVLETLGYLAETLPPTTGILVCPAPADEEAIRAQLPANDRVTIVSGSLGLPAQRNHLLAASTADVMLFFDDDFLPLPEYVEELVSLFQRYPEVVVATGTVLADGILNEGMDFQQGREILNRAEPIPDEYLKEVYNGYGCNMSIRMSTVREHGYQFDEQLPLYGWLEDLDFSRQMARHGQVVRSSRLRGVHLGTKKAGRSPGKRLGYSQVANPFYLVGKGTMTRSKAFKHIRRNVLSNLARSLRPEPWVDRRGRLAGNLLAFYEYFTGRLHPTRVIQL